jgi:hypothetical protein
VSCFGLVFTGPAEIVVAGRCSSGEPVSPERLAIGESFPERLETLIRSACGEGEQIFLAMEVYQTPVSNFPGIDSFLRGISRFAASGLTMSEDRRQILFGEIPDAMKWTAHGQPEMRLIFPGMAKAMFCFRNERQPTDTEIALSLAAICASPGQYCYCRSTGIVHSAGDAAVFLRSGPVSSVVVSATDWFLLARTPHTRSEVERGDVFLAYEMGKHQSPHLYPGNALKMGLLRVCREYGIALYCGSLDDDSGAGGLAAVTDSQQREPPVEHLVWGP